MRTTTNAQATIIVPETIMFSSTPFSYVKVSAPTLAYSTYTLRVTHDTQSVIVNRVLDSTGIALFPIGSILEALAHGSSLIRDVKIEVGNKVIASISVVIIGKSNKELLPASNQGGYGTAPAPSKIIIYAGYNIRQSMFCPYVHDEYQWELGYEGRVLNYDNRPWQDIPFLDFDTSELASVQPKVGQLYFQIEEESQVFRSFYQNAEIDECTDGVLLKWFDRHNIPCFYRFSIESKEYSGIIDSTFIRLNPNLQTEEKQARSLSLKINLNSRKVDEETFGLVLRILDCRDCYMYDTSNTEWIKVNVEDIDIEDDGAPMKSLSLSVILKNYAE